jgi:hypothetical protein
MGGMAIGYIAEPLAMYRWTTSSLSSNPRRVLDDCVIIFEELLADRSLLLRYGEEAADIARDRLYAVRRELSYLDRLEGRTSHSLGNTISLVRRWPLRTELYMDLVKACMGSFARPKK